MKEPAPQEALCCLTAPENKRKTAAGKKLTSTTDIQLFPGEEPSFLQGQSSDWEVQIPLRDLLLCWEQPTRSIVVLGTSRFRSDEII